MISKNIKEKIGLRITITNNKIKDIMKVIKFLENIGSLFKKVLEKLLVKKEDFSIFLGR